MVTVSVIIPVYNAEKYLRQCLDSVMCQTLTDIEIICVDDGSTDNSLAILREYEKSDARVKVLTQVNSGAGAARNAGMEQAAGEYLSFLDSDDLFEPYMLERMYSRAQDLDLDVVVCRSDRFTESGETLPCRWTIHSDILPREKVFCSGDVEKNFFKTFVWWPWDKLFKREYVAASGLRFQELRTTNDLYFVVCATIMAGRVSYIDDVLIHQRRTGESLSFTREKSWDCFYLALCSVRNYLIEHGIYGRFERDFINYALHSSMWNLGTLCGSSYAKLYNRLRDEWFADLGITGKPEDYFYDRREYRMYKFVRSNEVDKTGGKNVSDFIDRPKVKKSIFRRGIGVFSSTVRYFRTYGLVATAVKIADKLGSK